MGDRAILHSDMNCFYASVEMMLDPSLRGKPVAVCGSVENRHGIILAKSDLAKKAGIKTGMVSWEAKQLCRDVILVPPHYDQYIKYSRLAHDIYYRYTDLVEPYGMDECWCDVTNLYGHGTPHDIADEIRVSMKEELGLTVSVGVSYNKIFAKLGSDMKKPDAITDIPKESFKEKVWPLSVDELLYVGRATSTKLNRYGIKTIGDLAATPPDFLKYWFGVNGLTLWTFANGLDTSRVMHKDHVSPLKSIGHGITCNADLVNEEEVYHVMLELSQDVGHRLRVHDLTATGVQISIRQNNLDSQMYQCKLPLCTQLPHELANAAFQLFQRNYKWTTDVRAVCVRAINLQQHTGEEQLSVFVDNEKRIRREKLENAIEDVRRRYGKKSLTYASLMKGLKMPDDGRDQVRMPGMMYS